MPTKANKKAVAAAASRTPEAESALKELFASEIKDIYWAEKHLAAALPKMIKGATSEDLKQNIRSPLKSNPLLSHQLSSVQDPSTQIYKNPNTHVAKARR